MRGTEEKSGSLFSYVDLEVRIPAPALLHKWAESQGTPFPGQIYPAASAMDVPGAVQPFKTATRTWNSAT